jgi:hypothetical protein
MTLKINKETIRILLPEEQDMVFGGTGVPTWPPTKCIANATAKQQLGHKASEDVRCVKTAGCPTPQGNVPAIPHPWLTVQGACNAGASQGAGCGQFKLQGPFQKNWDAGKPYR